jgi:membrane associated rhomboid family serine protease
MSWRDRQYAKESYEGFGFSPAGVRRPPGATLALMILHGVAFLVMLALSSGRGAGLADLLALRGGQAQPIGILLYPLATTSVLSVLFVVLAYWSLGGRLERILHARRLVSLVIVANIVAGGAYFVFARWQPNLATAELDYPVGALAALCAVAWRSLRQEGVQVFGRTTTLAKIYAICAAIVVAMVVLRAGAGSAAWLVAAAVGAGCGAVFERMPAVRWRARVQPKRHVVRRRDTPAPPKAQPQQPSPDYESELDEILAKISREGMDALTAEERARLEAAREQKLRHGD